MAAIAAQGRAEYDSGSVGPNHRYARSRAHLVFQPGFQLGIIAHLAVELDVYTFLVLYLNVTMQRGGFIFPHIQFRDSFEEG